MRPLALAAAVRVAIRLLKAAANFMSVAGLVSVALMIWTVPFFER
jgi:hypothetical protein